MRAQHAADIEDGGEIVVSWTTNKRACWTTNERVVKSEGGPDAVLAAATQSVNFFKAITINFLFWSQQHQPPPPLLPG